MSSSNRRVTLCVSLLDGWNRERTRTPRRMFSNALPIGFGVPVVRIVPQESLPGVFGKTQAGTGGGAAAALDGKAIKPTPRAAAEARSNPTRFLVRIHLLLLRASARRFVRALAPKISSQEDRARRLCR
jgi:hypothetical protein